MANLWRITANWTGGKIGTGYSNLFFTAGISTAQLAADAVRAFFNTAYSSGGGMLPTGISISFAAGVDEIDETDGELAVTVPITAPAVITGADPTAYAAVAGACVTWLTQGVISGKRTRGRTFLVPMGGNGLQNDGTLAGTAVTNINSAAAALIAAAPELVVWRRQSAPGAGDGTSRVVLAHRLQDRTAYLTSRR